MRTDLPKDQFRGAQPPRACGSEPDAFDLFESVRWGEGRSGLACPRCAGTGVYKMTDRMNGARNGRFLWRCRACERQFTVRHGTMFQDSAIELHKWCRGLWEVTGSRGGTTPSQLARLLRITPKSAASMLRRFALVLPVQAAPAGGSQEPMSARLSVPMEWAAAVACVLREVRATASMESPGADAVDGDAPAEPLGANMPEMSRRRRGRAGA